MKAKTITKTDKAKPPAGWRVSGRTVRRVLSGRRRILGAAYVVKLAAFPSGRRSWCPVRSHGCWAADEIDYEWLEDWGRRVGMLREVRKIAAGEKSGSTFVVAGSTACGIYFSGPDGEKIDFVTEGGDEWENLI